MIPGLGGIIQAYQIFNQIQGQRRAEEQMVLEKEALAQRKSESEQRKENQRLQQEMQDVEMRAKMLELGRPLVNGLDVRQGEVAAGTMPGMAAPIPYEYGVKPDPAQVLKYKDLQVIPYSKKEREQQALEQYNAKKAADLEALQQQELIRQGIADQFKQAEAERNAIPLPAGVAEALGIAPGTRLPIAAAGPLIGQVQSTKRAEGERKSREQIAKDNREAANTRAAQSNATRERVASIRKSGSGGPTAGQSAVQQRFEERKIGRIEENESKAWAEVQQHEETIAQLNAANTGMFNKWSDEEKKRLVDAKAKAAAARTRAEGFLRQKQKAMGVPATQAPAQAAPGMPQTGEIREHQGAKYRFDGKQWVRQ